ncbi:MAG: hypothetical protein M3P93_15465 [Actinomycetota bacterium]|nr:hypothetical protein [Actinomycetota bacterium]
MRRTLTALLLSVLLLAGCGGSTDSTGDTGTGTGTGTGTAPTARAASASPAACPTENTRAFAKTRFVADIGGAAFLVRRYIYRPYQAGQFQQGAQGRTLALVKAAAAAAASAKLLSNAAENARANPTLCRTVAQPLENLTGTLNGLVGSLRNGSFDPGVVGGLGGAVTQVLTQSGRAGVPVQERPTGLS